MDQIYCQKCGTANADDARFCNSCGAAIPVQPQGPIPQQPYYAQQPQYSPSPQPYVQVPVQPVMYPQAPPPKKKRTGLVILIIVLALVLCCGGGGVTYYWVALRPIRGTAMDFLNALAAQDYVTAYNMSSAEMQSQLGNSPDGLQQFIESNGLLIQKYSTPDVQRFSGTPTTGMATTTADLANGKTVKLEVDLSIAASGNWQVMGFGLAQ